MAKRHVCEKEDVIDMIRDEVKETRAEMKEGFKDIKISLQTAIRQIDESKVGKTQHASDMKLITVGYGERIEALEQTDKKKNWFFVNILVGFIGFLFVSVIIPLIVYMFSKGA